ncbi:MAG: hydantoinase/oxoprolinase family protein, partial [Alphaproteobacteria bacterium]|nr:hydantoinase/oxoprolinase family protein [Alphaproteobacteria bacterium]
MATRGAGRLRIGVDVGGTFTDLVVVHDDGTSQVHKVPSNPGDPSAGVIEAVRAAARGMQLDVSELLARCDAFVHGSTIATNTVLERKGARVGMLTTHGFRDSVAIRRGLRRNPWDHRTPFAT